ncbi:MAG: YDG domain-containing protein [Planctomycetaceae bacterium]
MINLWTRLLQRLAKSPLRMAPRRGRRNLARLPLGAQALESRALLAAATTVQLSLPADPVTYGSASTLSAVVTTSDPTPATVTAGTVSFSVYVNSNWSVVGSDSLDDGVAEVSLSSVLSVGTYSIRAEYSGTENFDVSQDLESLAVTPRQITGSFSASDKTYDGSTTATVSGTPTLAGVLLVDDGKVTLTGTASFADENAGENKTVTLAGSLEGDAAGNYVLSADPITTTAAIAKADATVTTSNSNQTYDGLEHTASVEITGVGGVILTSASKSGTNVADSGSTTASISNDTNYNDASGTATLTITKATATVAVVDYTGVYDASAHTASVTITGVGGATLASSSLTGTDVSESGSVTASTSDPNYEPASGTATLTITKATATVAVVDYTGVYDASAHTASVTITGVGGATLASNSLTGTDVSESGSVTASTSDPNYEPASGTATLTINKATATVTVTGYSVTYDGTEHTAEGTAEGVDGEELVGLDLSGTAETDAGSYTGTWTFTDVTGNYNDASGTVASSIAKADAVIVVTGYSVTYDGTEHTATGTATGVNGEDLAGLDLSGTTQTNAGSYTGAWSFSDPNYNDQSGSVSSSILRATLTVGATAASRAYNGTDVADVSFTDDRVAADEAEGKLVVNFTSALFSDRFVEADKTVTILGLSLSGDSASNYDLAESELTATASITRKQITGSFTAGDKTYDSTATATVLTRTANGIEAGDDVTLVDGTAAFVTANAGTRAVVLTDAVLSGADIANYELVSVNNATAQITPATLTIDVTGYTGGTFDSESHTQTVTITGVGSDGVLFTDSLTKSSAGNHSKEWEYSNPNYTPDPATGTLAFTIGAREATAAYIGNTWWVTSGSSATTTQVTLSASLQDPTGLTLDGATVSFYDVSSGTPKLLAGNVKVAPVAGNSSTGTASTTVTLSTGQYGASSYFIQTVVSGNYTNDGQPDSDRTVAVSVVQPVGVNTIKGAGTLSRLSSAVGTYAPSGDASFSVGVAFNKSLKNLQGQITLFLPQADGSVIYIKSNSLTSMTAANLSIGKVNTIYSKANVSRLNADGTSSSVEGNLTLRLDVTGNGPAAKVAFTILSGSVLRYSNNWIYDTTAKAWKTGFQSLFSGAVSIG